MKRILPLRPAMTPAVVREWHDDLGWGVLDSPSFPGGCWAHYSVIHGSGYLALTRGQQVWVGSESADQDGFGWRATEVRLSGDPDEWLGPVRVNGPAGGYQSTLTLSFDDGREVTVRGDESMPDFLNRAYEGDPPG